MLLLVKVRHTRWLVGLMVNGANVNGSRFHIHENIP